MSALEKAARQALGAMGLIGADLVCGASSHHRRTDLHGDEDVCPIRSRWHDAFEKLSRALAQQAEPVVEPKPYCYVYEYDTLNGVHRAFYPRSFNGRMPDRAIPVYTHPPQQAEPVQAEPVVVDHRRDTDADNGQSMIQAEPVVDAVADSGNPSY
jgi:hypothetical protein